MSEILGELLNKGQVSFGKFTLFLLIVFIGCKKHESGRVPLARLDDQTLTLEEVQTQIGYCSGSISNAGAALYSELAAGRIAVPGSSKARTRSKRRNQPAG